MARRRSGPPPVQQRRTAAATPAKAAPAGAKAVVAQGAGAVKAAAPEAPRKRVSLPQFVNEVRAEARKITWTTRKETWITSVMVFMMVVVTAVFFLVIDQVLGQSLHLLLSLAA